MAWCLYKFSNTSCPEWNFLISGVALISTTRVIKFKAPWLALLAILLTAATVAASAAPPVVLQIDRNRYALEPHLEIFEDSLRSHDIASIMSPEIDAKFRPVGENGIMLGITESAYWLRFKVLEKMDPENGPNFPSQRAGWILDVGKPWIDKIDVYIPVEDGAINAAGQRYSVIQAGDSRPTANGQISNGTFSFKFPPHFKHEAFFFIRMESSTSLTTPITLWSETSFRDHISKMSFRFGLIFGAMLAMILFNLFICVSLRDRIYLFYVLFMGGMLFYLFCAYGHIKDLIPPLPPHLVSYTFLSMLGAAYFFAFAFSKEFLGTKKTAPALNKMLTALMVVSLSLIPMGVLEKHFLSNLTAHILGLVGPFALLSAGVVSMSRGFRPARFFLMAWFMLLFGSALYAFKGLGLIPHTLLSFYSVAVGAALESILLSFALADRINGLRKEKEELKISERRYQRLSFTDGLTGLYNKRYLMSKLISEVGHAQRMEGALSLIMIDVDDFKKFNDVFGHQEGDAVLRALSKVIMESIRERDGGCRYGGEEFTIILPRIDAREAAKVAERIRSQFSHVIFRPSNGPKVTATISLGVSELNEKDTAQELLCRADKALYKAKNSGKNRVVVDTEIADIHNKAIKLSPNIAID